MEQFLNVQIIFWSVRVEAIDPMFFLHRNQPADYLDSCKRPLEVASFIHCSEFYLTSP
jgi:hypothetical protein